MRQGALKRITVLFCFLGTLGFAVEASAFNLRRFDFSHLLETFQTTRMKSDLIEERPTRIPEGCWEEEVQHPPAESAGWDCHRIVCGPFFFGHTAMDLCDTGVEIDEAEFARRMEVEPEEFSEEDVETEPVRYQVWKIRFPTREISSDPWEDYYIQTRLSQC